MQGLDEAGERDENMRVENHPEGGNPMSLTTFPKEDPHGEHELTARNMAKRDKLKVASRRLHMHHLPRNGAYDAVTHYHVLDALMRVKPGQTFRSRELIADELRPNVPISWDATTVGRVINDISEALQDAYGFKVISPNRRFDGLWFDVSGHPEARAALQRLLEDLAKLSEEELSKERDGVYAKRLLSPMAKCPSVSL